MFYKTTLGGFAAAVVSLSMLGGAFPAAATTATFLAPTGHSDYNDADRKCWDVNYYKHRGHWHMTWRDSDGKHNKRAATFREAVDDLKDECDRVGA